MISRTSSIFARLVTVMVIMAVTLLLLVAGGFWFLAAPSIARPHVLGDGVPRLMLGAHATLFIGLLLVMSTVVLTAHTVLRRMLAPLRGLSEGVARLGAGELDIVLPNRSSDEFGALTSAFNKMVGRVREMISARDQLLLDVSHELRSPLTRMKVALELMPASEERSRIARDIDEMAAMIAELLELERLRSGRDINRVRQDLLPVLREVAAAHGTDSPGIEVLGAEGQILVDVDADRMRVVLRNLVENAVKYSLPDSRPVELAAAIEDGRVVLRITDDGPGIPEQDMANLFEPFFRVDRSRSKRTGGYGLGLSISKRIVEAHGGTIRAQNNAGRGASFVVTLPKPM